jgi:C4-dicarboxylate-specific signal transduction histidine kinase
MNAMSCFNPTQLRTVRQARERAARLVSDYYCVAPREWRQMPYEVKTLRALDHTEVTDAALAQTVCYNFKRAAGPVVIEEGDLYRICLQDHRILDAMRHTRLGLGALLTYVLTHELVHVVRFGQRLQRIDLPVELRDDEERKVERTTRTILTRADASLRHFFAGHSDHLF